MRILILVLCLAACGGDHGLATDGRGSSGQVNAFALGYFSGLTVGISDVMLGSLMTRGQVESAREDRNANSGWDSLGKLLGFATLLWGGWKLYARIRRAE